MSPHPARIEHRAVGAPGLSKRPFLVTSAAPATVRAVVVVAHGGRETGTSEPGRCGRGLLRMVPIARDLARRGADHGLLVTQLRYRMTGYNDGAPVEDVRWAIAELTRTHGVATCLVGHSMGGRAVLQAAGSDGVVGVVALAPWCPPTDPVEQLQDRSVMFAHGLRDNVTSPARSREYALRVRAITPRVCRFELDGSGHGMVRRARLWHRLTTSFVLGALGMRPMPAQVTDALALPPDRACAVAL